MANTEKVAILKQIREAETIVSDTLDKSGLTQAQRNMLNDLLDVLREIDNLVLLNELNENIGFLKDKSKELKKVNTRVKKQTEKLKDVADKVEKAAKGIDAIIKVFGILVGAGLI
jgi:DNA mismatch repair ATPase MutS